MKRLIILSALVLLPGTTWSALPLITDDTGTQGKGKFQVEVGGEYDREKETFEGVTVKETDYLITPTLTYGITDPVDIFITVPYVWSSVETEGDPGAGRVNGISDTTFGAKWRFYEKEKLSFGLKPIVTVPTGNYEKTLGTGRVDYGVTLIITREFDPWAFHANFGYTRNENRIGERENLWHVSAAAEYEVVKDLKLCADAGVDTNRDKTSEVEPAYLLGGIIYSAAENMELSFAVKKALNDAEIDWAILPGITYRF